MTAMLKQFQSNLPPAQVKAVEEICVTCGGAHPYYQCLAAGGNTFPEYRDNIQGYVLAATGNFNQGNPGYRPQGVANQMCPPGNASISSERTLPILVLGRGWCNSAREPLAVEKHMQSPFLSALIQPLNLYVTHHSRLQSPCFLP
nr:hypothetical protein [Tanacetum cinerariifolium]